VNGRPCAAPRKTQHRRQCPAHPRRLSQAHEGHAQTGAGCWAARRAAGRRAWGRTDDFVWRAIDLDSQSILEVIGGHLGRPHAHGRAAGGELHMHEAAWRGAQPAGAPVMPAQLLPSGARCRRIDRTGNAESSLPLQCGCPSHLAGCKGPGGLPVREHGVSPGWMPPPDRCVSTADRGAQVQARSEQRTRAAGAGQLAESDNRGVTGSWRCDSALRINASPPVAMALAFRSTIRPLSRAPHATRSVARTAFRPLAMAADKLDKATSDEKWKSLLSAEEVKWRDRGQAPTHDRLHAAWAAHGPAVASPAKAGGAPRT